jgi:uncharacterized protein (DUF1501 family)
MLDFHSQKGAQFCDGLTRRDFLRAGTLSAGAVGLSLVDTLQARSTGAAPAGDINCILLFLVGGPSQLDTWDPKPDAPDHVRGPFKPIDTNVPGIRIGEHFPLMAGMADRYALLRSVYHREAPIHETGHQLMQTGHLFRRGVDYPHFGAALSHLKGPAAAAVPPFVVLPGPIGHTGVSVSHGQSAGYLGAAHEPAFACANVDPARLTSRHGLVDAADGLERAGGRIMAGTAPLFSPRAKQAFDIAAEDDRLRARYGLNTFGQSCLLARRLVESGVRFVTVNMFDTVFSQTTWDCHADGATLSSSLHDYKETLCPMFDLAYTALLDDLQQRGLLSNTLVVAMGEFGRTPQLNPRGGRDHWPGVWSILFAGGRVRGGQAIGSSDAWGASPKDRPITPQEVAASVYHGVGLEPGTTLPGPDHRPRTLVEAQAIEGLFA